MIPDRLESPNWSTSVLEFVDADGVKKLREYHPRQRRRTDLPPVGVWRVHRPGVKPAKTGKKHRSAKMRCHEPSSSQSSINPSTNDRQISVQSEFLKKAKKDDAHSSDIPIRVFSPADSPKLASQAVPVISQSAELHLSFGRGKPSVTDQSVASPVAASPDGSADEGQNRAAECTSYHGIYDDPAPINTLQICLSPRNNPLTVANESHIGSGTHASFSTLAGACDHSYEEVIIQRCKHCGCYSAIDAVPSGAANQGPLRPYYHSQPSNIADNYLTGTSTSTDYHELLAILSGFPTWDHHQAGNQACAGASGAMLGPVSSSSPMHRGTQSNLYLSPLMIPESMHYREPPSLISASPSSYSPGSSSFQPTPVSSSSQPFLSPLLHFPDLSSDSPSGGWPADPRSESGGFPSS